MNLQQQALTGWKLPARRIPPRPALSHTVIQLRNVRKTYRLYGSFRDMALDRMGAPRFMLRKWGSNIRDFHALDSVNLTVRRGERLGIIGRNGAGKTTMLKMIIGNFQPTEGQVEVDGSVQALMQIGLGFNWDTSGYDNVRAALLYNGLEGAALQDATDEVAEFVELGDFLHQPVSTYSQGMLARLQFATATAVRPDVMVIDEIMGAGDAYFTAKCAHRMRELTHRGCTLLLVSHSSQQVIQYCDRAIWLREGRIFKDGNATEVVAAYEVYIERLIAKGVPEVEELPQTARLAGLGEPAELTDELLNTMSDGRRVHRWAGKPGVEIGGFSFVPGGSSVSRVKTGETMEIEFELRISATGDFGCAYYIGFWTADGHRACRIESPVDYFHAAAGDRRKIRTSLSPVLLGSGEYKVSFSIYDRLNSPSTRSAPDRYDVLMRCYTLEVDDQHPDTRATAYPPASWQFHSTADR